MISLVNSYELLKIYISNKDYKLFNTEKSIYIDNIKLKIYEYLINIKGFKENKFFNRNIKGIILKNYYIINKERYNKFIDFKDFLNKMENTNIYLGNNYFLYDEITEIFDKIQENKTRNIYNRLDNYYKSLLLIIENSYYKNDNNKTIEIIRCKVRILSNLMELIGNKINERYSKFFNKNIKIVSVYDFINKIEDIENNNRLFYEKINEILISIKNPKIKEITI